MDTTPEDQYPPIPGSPAGPGSWVVEAIARQEEHLRRLRPCESTGAEHSWDRFSAAPATGDRPAIRYEACWRCGVTRSDADYQAQAAART